MALANPQPKLRPSVSLRDADGLPVYETEGVLMQQGSFTDGRRVTLKLVPFASAGALGKEFAVWLGGAVG